MSSRRHNRLTSGDGNSQFDLTTRASRSRPAHPDTGHSIGVCSVYIPMVTMALWLLRLVMSAVWLHWLATCFRPLFDTLQHLVADLYLFPICLALALVVGAFHVVFNSQLGHGWRVMLSTLVIAVLGFMVTRDPISELASDNGMLTQARNLGFAVSSAALNNGGIVAGNSSAQMNSLIQHIADSMVRIPLQLFNFGTVTLCQH